MVKKRQVRRKKSRSAFRACMRKKLKGKKFRTKKSLRKAFRAAAKSCARGTTVRHRRVRHVVKHRVYRRRI